METYYETKNKVLKMLRDNYKNRIDFMLGDSVFLTREEAEQALKEREKT